MAALSNLDLAGRIALPDAYLTGANCRAAGYIYLAAFVLRKPWNFGRIMT
jgi:hypothetical protein